MNVIELWYILYPMISIFLGAGFSYVGGVPLAHQLFDRKPVVDRVTREDLVERVHQRWVSWNAKHGGAPEEYLANLEKSHDKRRSDAIWYVGLVITLATAQVERVGRELEITRHYINRTTQIPIHEDFWTIIFRKTVDVAVMTTNYDILPERGLRHKPRPSIPRPGFHYGNGEEDLAGGGFPSYSHLQKMSTQGSVPLLKLHGSVSWSVRDGKLVKYHDCRPAIRGRGDPAIVAPVTHKKIPPFLKPIWKLAGSSLSSSDTWIIVGYSLPEYDLLVRDLFENARAHSPAIHVFDPNPAISERYSSFTENRRVFSHPGLPDGLEDLTRVMNDIFSEQALIGRKQPTASA
jgi:hypothetical protein